MARDHSRGAAAVEFALVAPLLIFLVFGIIEAGFAFYGREATALAVSDASRAGSIQRNDAAADREILTLLGGRLDRAAGTSFTRVVVYEAATLTDPPPAACIAGSPVTGCNVYGPAALANPASATCTGWCPADRETDDLLGVWVGVRYDSLTEIVPLNFDFGDWAVTRIEPQVVG